MCKIEEWLSIMAARSIVKRFAAAIRQCRIERGLTQEQLAFEAELHRNFVSGMERGIKNPSLTTIESLAKALSLSASALVARAELGSTGKPDPAASAARGNRKSSR